MNLNLDKKVALIFGGSQGIGFAIAKSLKNEACQVIIASRSEQNLKLSAKELDCSYLVCDLSKEGEATKAVENVLKDYGRLDILILNTGGPKKGNFSQIEISQWKQDFQSLWLSSIEAINSSLLKMQKNKYGRILFISSIAAKEALDELTTSNGLRAGIGGLCRSLSNEYSIDGITFNVLLPGYTNTDRLKKLNLSSQTVQKLIPAGRLGEPEELADLACFLSSPRASYITGQSIAVDGGVLKGF